MALPRRRRGQPARHGICEQRGRGAATPCGRVAVRFGNGARRRATDGRCNRADNRHKGTDNRHKGTDNRHKGTHNQHKAAKGTDNRHKGTGNRHKGTDNRHKGTDNRRTAYVAGDLRLRPAADSGEPRGDPALHRSSACSLPPSPPRTHARSAQLSSAQLSSAQLTPRFSNRERCAMLARTHARTHTRAPRASGRVRTPAHPRRAVPRRRPLIILYFFSKRRDRPALGRRPRGTL